MPGNTILAGCQYQYPHQAISAGFKQQHHTDSCPHPALSNIREIHLMASGPAQVRPERAVVVQLVIQLVSVFAKLVTDADDPRLLQILSS